MRQTIFM
ncbi:hypothetical protein Bhyg_07920 [Pseudolycoriella hygida]|nr:hypothetical protein Bhyg_07920 [Pseudolycoriella hygida]